MPKFSVTIPHSLTKEEAVQRLGKFADKVQEHYKDTIKDFEQSWDGDVSKFSFKTFGLIISGKMLIDAPEVKLEGEMPFAAMMFKGKIEQSIRGELAKLLS
jgi:Putative polyhydroxyalkanoic acid system protein (PHA_gran_rgn)